LDTLSFASQFGIFLRFAEFISGMRSICSYCKQNHLLFCKFKVGRKGVYMYVCMYVCLSECLFWIANNSIYCLTSSIHWHAIYLIGKGIPGDGRCLFRSVVHGALLRAGKSSPSEGHQKELADELRAKVQHKLTFNDFTRRVMLC